ncbi:dGTPase [Methanococcus voltae PS]|uniref:DGTPase n=1 Tax=Methanococcus voltae PS TaxID=523842 RepID=A0ABT2EVJ0_METVO|nr:dNTP triphosphohydrolase [Methanococcus voltae]MCS3921967.1 dGTPase [Methanococcus voltae PS]
MNIKNYDHFRTIISEKLAQKSKETDRRFYGLEKEKMPLNSAEHPYAVRKEFERDRGRIMFSKSFRRLEHKAQIYTHEKGDHYRNRLTHTIEVSQLSRSLAKNLGLNVDLAEAIAVGHDIGHTPFGHEGERVLHEIMSGNNSLGGKIEYNLPHGGFKHNYQGLKVLDILECRHEKSFGLNLTWQVLEGVLKHTRTKLKKCANIDENDKKLRKYGDCKNCNSICYDLEKFLIDEELINKKIINAGKHYNKNFNNFLKDMACYENSVTLEGQIVAIADEIAQRQHDLDDGLRDEKLGMEYGKLLKTITEAITDILHKNSQESDEKAYSLLSELLNSLECHKQKYQELQESTENNEFYIKELFIRDIIDYFIKDVSYTSFENIYKNEHSTKDSTNPCEMEQIKNEMEKYKDFKYYPYEVITFSELGEELNKKLESIINKICLSNDVRRFDAKSEYIIKQLYKAYYNKPEQLSNAVIKIIEYRLNNAVKKYFCMLDEDSLKPNPQYCSKENNIRFLTFNFEDGISKPLELPSGEKISIVKLLKLDSLEIIKFLEEYSGEKEISTLYNKNEEERLKDYYTELLKKPFKNIDSKERYLRFILACNYIYMSSICDHIALMTDSYAKKEYKALYME